MHWFFFSLLVVGIVSGYFYSRYENELTSLLGAIAVISYLISLIIAPLPIHVFLLFFVFIVTDKLLWINTCKLSQNESNNSDPIDSIELTLQEQSHQNLQTNQEETSSPPISAGSIAAARISHLFKYRGATFFHQAFSNQTFSNPTFSSQELNPQSKHNSADRSKIIGKYRGNVIVGK